MLLSITAHQQHTDFSTVLGGQFSRFAKQFKRHWPECRAESFGDHPYRFATGGFLSYRSTRLLSVVSFPSAEQPAVKQRLHECLHLYGKVAFEDFFLTGYLDCLDGLDPGWRACRTKLGKVSRKFTCRDFLNWFFFSLFFVSFVGKLLWREIFRSRQQCGQRTGDSFKSAVSFAFSRQRVAIDRDFPYTSNLGKVENFRDLWPNLAGFRIRTVA